MRLAHTVLKMEERITFPFTLTSLELVNYESNSPTLYTNFPITNLRHLRLTPYLDSDSISSLQQDDLITFLKSLEGTLESLHVDLTKLEFVTPVVGGLEGLKKVELLCTGDQLLSVFSNSASKLVFSSPSSYPTNPSPLPPQDPIPHTKHSKRLGPNPKIEPCPRV